MQKVIFYSWQSDLENSRNRGLIQKALEKCAKDISRDENIEVEPRIDRDTSGVGGSVDISATIFEKILKADVFVADVSTINKADSGRKVPNPNVLIELGYAMKALSKNQIVLVINQEFGDLSLLPFDLRTRKVITYDTSEDKRAGFEELSGKLKAELTTILESLVSEEYVQPSVIDIVKEQKPDRLPTIKAYMKSLKEDLEVMYPGDGMIDSTTPDPEYDQKIIDALEKTQGFILTFRKVIDQISLYDDISALKIVFQGFKPIIENFDHSKKFLQNGTTHKAKYDYYKFLGNELFVVMVSIFLREEKWDLLRYVLKEEIIIDNYRGYQTKAVDFTYFSQYAISFALRSQRLKSTRFDLRYDFLIERRKSEVDYVDDPVEEYKSADLLLFLKGETPQINSTTLLHNWHPWSLIEFSLPRFVLLARNKKYANALASALSVDSAQDIQVLVKNKVSKLGERYQDIFWDNPIEDEHINQIGSAQ